MTTSFTDRDERQWQRYAEERPARPLPLGAWLRALRAPGAPRTPRASRAPRAPFRFRTRRAAAPPGPQTTG